MSNKILLAVDSELVDDFISMLNSRRAGKATVKQAKLDAEAYIKDKCIALIDEILKHECEMYNHLRHRVVKVEDILKIKEKL